MNTSAYKNSTVKLSAEPSPILQRLQSTENLIKTDSDTCSARESDFEEKKVISVNHHKYSSTKKNKSPANKFTELTSRDFEEADQINFKTYEEYNEEDFTFETVTEIIVEEQECEESTISRFDVSGRKSGRMSKVGYKC
jgi:hypothetical protein